MFTRQTLIPREAQVTTNCDGSSQLCDILLSFIVIVVALRLTNVQFNVRKYILYENFIRVVMM